MINKRVNAENIRYLCTHKNIQYKLHKKGYIQISNLYYRLHFGLSMYYDTLSILFTTSELVFFSHYLHQLHRFDNTNEC